MENKTGYQQRVSVFSEHFNESVSPSAELLAETLIKIGESNADLKRRIRDLKIAGKRIEAEVVYLQEANGKFKSLLDTRDAEVKELFFQKENLNQEINLINSKHESIDRLHEEEKHGLRSISKEQRLQIETLNIIIDELLSRHKFSPAVLKKVKQLRSK